MTAALNIGTIVTAISNLSVSGLAIKDTSAIPDKVDGRSLPVMVPDPVGFVDSMKVERVTTGGGGNAAYNVSYTLNYIVYYAALGQDRGLFVIYQGMVAMAELILESLLNTVQIAGEVDFDVQTPLKLGPVADPTGKIFHGFEVKIKVQEYT